MAESLVDPVAAAEHAHHVVPKRKRRGTIGMPVSLQLTARIASVLPVSPCTAEAITSRLTVPMYVARRTIALHPGAKDSWSN